MFRRIRTALPFLLLLSLRIGGLPTVGPAALVLVPAAVAASVAGCEGNEAASGASEDTDLDQIQVDLERALEDGKADSPDAPVILGDIRPGMQASGQFRPERRFVAWTFGADGRPAIQVSATAVARPSSGVALFLMWRPSCNSAWRTVSRGGQGLLDQSLPTDGNYLIVVGPRNARSSGRVQALLTLAAELLSTIGPGRCLPGPFDRPPVPPPIPPTPTNAPGSKQAVGTIAGSFQVTDRGTASYSVPVSLPPGRASVEPKLALAYDSSAPNGLLGMRFRLQGLSTISRCAKDPAHDGQRDGIRFSPDDRLCLDGARLVQVPGRSPPEYRTERETFTRIRAYSGEPSTSGPEFFRAWTKDGRILEFGRSQDGSGEDPRARGIPIRQGTGNYTLAWPLRRVEDRSGNFLTIQYGSESGPFGETVEQWPVAIRYTAWTDKVPGGAAVVQPTRQVSFNYCAEALDPHGSCPVASRPDVFTGFSRGVHVARRKLLHSIDISGPAPTISGDPGPVAVVQQYRLHYGTDAATNASRLDSLEECASNGTEALTCKPPTTFHWQDSLAGFGAARTLPLGMPSVRPITFYGIIQDLRDPRLLAEFFNIPVVIQSDPTINTIDMDGDGRSDLLFPQGDTWQVLHGLPGGRFDPTPIPTGLRAAPVAEHSDVMLAGDVRDPDLVTVVSKLWDQRSVTPLDYNGDGLTDLLVTVIENGVFGLRIALAEGIGSSTGGVPGPGTARYAPRAEWIPVWTGTSRVDAPRHLHPTVRATGTLPPPIVIDLDGDARPDVLFCDPYTGQWLHFSAPQDGQFSATRDAAGPAASLISYPPNAAVPQNCGDQSVLPLDIDGDGKTELLGGAADANYATTNIRTSDFQGPVINGVQTPSWTKRIDINGDGLSDIVSIQHDAASTGGVVRTFVNRGNGIFEINTEPFPFGPPVPPELRGAFASRSYFDSAVIADYDGDGRSDLLVSGHTASAQSSSYVYLSDGTGLVQAPVPPSMDASLKYATPLDVDGDGLVDLAGFITDPAHPKDTFLSLRLHAGAFQVPGVITEIRNGLISHLDPDAYPATIKITHLPMIDPALQPRTGTTVHQPASTGCTYPVHCLHAGPALVSAVAVDNGGVMGGVAEQAFSYANARRDLRGRGFLGFSERRTHDLTTGAVTARSYFQGNDGAGPMDEFQAGTQTDYRLAGMVSSETTTVPLPDGGAHVSTIVNTPFVEVVQRFWPGLSRSAGTYLPFIQATTVTEASRGSVPGTAPVPYKSVTTTTQLDGSAFGCVRSVKTDFGDGFTDSSEVTASTSDEAEWLLCLPGTHQRKGLSPEEPDGVVQTTAFTYYAHTRLVKSATRAPSGDLVATANRQAGFSRDRYGNSTQLDISAPNPDCNGTDRSCKETRTSTVAFDSDGMFPVSQTNAAGHVVQLRYHPTHGVLLVRQDENGVSTRWSHDGFARVGRQLDPDNTDTMTTLRPVLDLPHPGFEVEVNTVGGDDVITRHDSLGRETRRSSTVLDGRSFVETQYNTQGLVERVSRPATDAPGAAATQFTSLQHDPLGRVVSVATPDGAMTRTTHSFLVSETTDPNGHLTRVARDARGEVVESTGAYNSPRAAQTRYVYGAFGRTLRIEAQGDAGDTAITHLDMDAYGRRVSILDPDLGPSTSRWSGFDELVESVNPAGQSTHFLRDALGRVRKRLDPGSGKGPAIETTWTWDTANFGIGKIAETTSARHERLGAVHRVAFRYDRLSRPVEVATSLGGDETYVVQTDYTAASQIDTISYPASPGLGPFAIRHHYDDHGTLRSIGRWDPQAGSEGQEYWSAKLVDPDGQITDEAFGSGVHTLRSYYPETGRQHTITTGVPGRSPLQELAYDYYPNGNLLRRDDRALSQREAFEYDELDRLTGASPQGGAALGLTYDALGNIRSKTGIGTYRYNAPRPGGGVRQHAVSQTDRQTFEYDDATGGVKRRMDPDAGIDQEIHYTAFGKPSWMSASAGQPELSIEYDADGNRVLRQSASKRSVYVGNLYQRDTIPDDVALSPGEPREIHRYFIHAGGRAVAQVARSSMGGIGRSGPGPSGLSEEVIYVHDDHLGSTSVISDGRGALREPRRSFDAFGSPRQPNLADPSTPPAASAFPLGFTGQEDDPLGLVNMKGRIYDPKIARFLQADPIPNPHVGQSLNRYSYVRNNPLRHTDPSGLSDTGVPEAEGGEAPLPPPDFLVTMGPGPEMYGPPDVPNCEPGRVYLSWGDVCSNRAPSYQPLMTPVDSRGSGDASANTGANIGITRARSAAEARTMGVAPFYGWTTPGAGFVRNAAQWSFHAEQAMSGYGRGLTAGAVNGAIGLATSLATAQLPPGIDAITFNLRGLGAHAQASVTAALAPSGNIGNQHYIFAMEVEPAVEMLAAGAGVLGVVREIGATRGGTSLLSDAALVCRGGTCSAERFLNGSGVVSDAAGKLSGVSVNVGEGTVGEVAATLRYKQVGVSTVGEVRAAGGLLTPKPTPFNPLHHELSGLSAETLEQLFSPTVRNPNL